MPQVVVAFAVSDKAKLQSVIDAHMGGAQVASTDYEGMQIKTVAQPGGTSMSGSYAITDDALLVAPGHHQAQGGARRQGRAGTRSRG